MIIDMVSEYKCPDCDMILIEYDTGSNVFHCATPHCKFQYFNKKTGAKIRKE